MDIIIYHNPACGTSRNALELIRHVGIEPHVIEYLKTPPSRAMVAWLAERTGTPLRDLTDEQLLDAIEAHPILLNRPIVVSPLGVRLCRPSEAVLDLLPVENLKPFTKEDGEVVIDADGRRVAR